METTRSARIAAQLRRLARDAEDRLARAEPVDETLAWLIRECRDLATDIERPGYHMVMPDLKEPR